MERKAEKGGEKMPYTSFSSIIPSFLIILIGYAVGKVFSDEVVGLASKVAIWVMVPTVTFTFINKYTPGFSELRDFGLGIIVIFLFFYLYSSFFKHRRGVVLVTAVTSNAGYLGYPILMSLWGEQALALGVVYALLIVLMYTILPAFLGERFNLKNLFKLPYIYALPAGFITGKLGLHYEDLPSYLLSAINMLKQAAIPYLLLYVGLSVSRVKMDKRVTGLGGLIIFNKLFLSPLIALLFVMIYKLDGLSGKVFILETAMPTAINSVVIVSALGGDSKTVGLGVTLTTFFAIFTLPIWAVLLEKIFG
ncbi:Auxin Efflux Carrier [Thermotoga neapolitana DSM 4359]|jgi:predicted permease|uniref:Auxin Efflux Carrier n=2 Tax=Thermotoga neapolitana TaxID=2337 RepID=B9KBM6_THENN|nr:Auxin Efflux Carrier [Thermotoga neapolitana DSM 4359]